MQEPVRINKYLSEAGVCSRREADRQVEAGNVTIDGVVAFHGSKSIARPDGSFLRKAGKKRRGNDTSGISQANRNCMYR